jgi:chromosomal replication initiation ATPase DnaA
MMAHNGADYEVRRVVSARGMTRASVPRPSDVRRALAIIESVTGVAAADVVGGQSFRPFVRARWLFVLAFRQFDRAGWPYSSFPMIARVLNKRDHTTIVHASQAASALLTTDLAFALHWAQFQEAWDAARDQMAQVAA